MFRRKEFTSSLRGFKSNTQQTVKGRRAPAPVVKQRDVFRCKGSGAGYLRISKPTADLDREEKIKVTPAFSI